MRGTRIRAGPAAGGARHERALPDRVERQHLPDPGRDELPDRSVRHGGPGARRLTIRMERAMESTRRITEYIDLDLAAERWRCNRCGADLGSARDTYKKGCLIAARDP